MHPARSVILFTTLSGAGYGLIFLLIAAHQLGLITADPLTGFLGFGLGFAMVIAGLLSSTFHLGHPERAWRALTQWRSSWLSREGVMALFTFLPTGLYGLWWCFFSSFQLPLLPLLGLIGMAGALGTVYCTAMIYASLRTVRAWNNSLGAVLLSDLCADDRVGAAGRPAARGGSGPSGRRWFCHPDAVLGGRPSNPPIGGS